MADHIHRAHHVGSLLRPGALREAWRQAEGDGLHRRARRRDPRRGRDAGRARARCRHRWRVPSPLVLEPLRRAGGRPRGGRGAVLVHRRIGRSTGVHGTPRHRQGGRGPRRSPFTRSSSCVRSPTATSRSRCPRHRRCSSGSARSPGCTSPPRRSSRTSRRCIADGDRRPRGERRQPRPARRSRARDAL